MELQIGRSKLDMEEKNKERDRGQMHHTLLGTLARMERKMGARVLLGFSVTRGRCIGFHINPTR